MKPEERRRIAREWCDFAIGRTPSDPVYRWVTEGRDPGPIYSSCGDLAHVEGFYRRRPLSMVPVQSWLNLDDVPLVVGEVDLPSGERFDALESEATYGVDLEGSWQEWKARHDG